MKVIAMIPARLGSTRVKDKCIRFLGDKPLVCHVLDTLLKSENLFDAIYLNASEDIFKNLVATYDNPKLKFYQRPEQLSQSSVTNDLFMEDFLNHTDCDYVIQVNPTSPFISSEDVQNFKKYLIDNEMDTVQSIKEERIEGIFNGIPLNFHPDKIMPQSQHLEPIHLFSSGIMGFNKSSYLLNMKKHGAATYGAQGKTGHFILKGYSTLDIDVEDDFLLAECIYEVLRGSRQTSPRYYSHQENLEADVPSILFRDGVNINDLFDSANQTVANIEEIISKKPSNQSWSVRLINTESNSATLIHQLPGEGNRLHYHPNWNEWWYIVQGKWEFVIENKSHIIKQGEVVYIPKNQLHQIKAIGEIPAIRLAVSREDVVHIYPKKT